MRVGPGADGAGGFLGEAAALGLGGQDPADLGLGIMRRLVEADLAEIAAARPLLEREGAEAAQHPAAGGGGELGPGGGARRSGRPPRRCARRRRSRRRARSPRAAGARSSSRSVASVGIAVISCGRGRRGRAAAPGRAAGAGIWPARAGRACRRAPLPKRAPRPPRSRPFLPMPPIFFITSAICRCIFSRRFSSCTSSPAPAAMRRLRLAWSSSGLRRSLLGHRVDQRDLAAEHLVVEAGLVHLLRHLAPCRASGPSRPDMPPIFCICWSWPLRSFMLN